jgi:hypothetical protein
MFVRTGPAEYNYDETISTLRYANRAKNIKVRCTTDTHTYVYMHACTESNIHTYVRTYVRT